MKRLNHLPSSAQVLVFSWASVLAVMTPRVSGPVEKDHRISHATRADLPTPWPVAAASWMAERRGSPAWTLFRTSSCQGSGPVARSSVVPALPQGKALSTNATGSLLHEANQASSSSKAGPPQRAWLKSCASLEWQYWFRSGKDLNLLHRVELADAFL